MAEPASIAIEVVYALPERQALLRLSVPYGTRVREAVLLSGIAAQFPDLDVQNCPLGIFGKAVAKRAHGFSMRVLYWTPRRKPEAEERAAGLTYVPLDDLLRESDFVSLHSPLNAQTRHQIGKREFGLMKKTAFIVNTARGPIIDEEALVRALKAKKIAGAGLDVFEREPKVHADLKKMRNVVLNPHLGSATVEVREEMASLVVDNIEALLSGRTPPNSSPA